MRGRAVFVSGGYFAVLGLGPALGRVLGQQDVADPQPSTVMLSFDYWTTAFGADPGVVGKTLLVSGQPLEIVGVAPRGFVGTTPGERPNVFVPITLEWYQDHEAPTPVVDNRQFSYLYVFGRLQPGVSREEAEQRLNATFRAVVNDVEAPAAAADPDYRSLEAFKARTLSLVSGAGPEPSSALRARPADGVFRCDRHDTADRLRQPRQSHVCARCGAHRRDGGACLARRRTAQALRRCSRSKRCCSRVPRLF